MYKTIILLTLLFISVALLAEDNNVNNLKQELNLSKQFWLSWGLGFGSTNSSGACGQFGYFLQGILQNQKLTYSAHYQGFSELNLFDDFLPLFGESITDREINKGHILGLQLGFVPVDMALKKQLYETSQFSLKLSCAAGFSCNWISQGTNYNEEWRGPYNWSTNIGFPLSLDLMILRKQGGGSGS